MFDSKVPSGASNWAERPLYIRYTSSSRATNSFFFSVCLESVDRSLWLHFLGSF